MRRAPDFLARAAIFGAPLVLMLLNLVAMPILRYLGMPLQIAGTVLGVIQVTLGLQVVVIGLRGLGMLART